jgi:hypothetical protein
MFDRYIAMYVLKHDTQFDKNPQVKLTTGDSVVQNSVILLHCPDEEQAKQINTLAHSVHRLSRMAVMKFRQLNEVQFSTHNDLAASKDMYTLYFGRVCDRVGNTLPELLRVYYYEFEHEPLFKVPTHAHELTSEDCTDMFQRIVVAWASAPDNVPQSDEGTINNAGGGKCGYISVMLSLLLNGRDTFEAVVTKMCTQIRDIPRNIAVRTQSVETKEQNATKLTSQIKACKAKRTELVAQDNAKSRERDQVK